MKDVLRGFNRRIVSMLLLVVLALAPGAAELYAQHDTKGKIFWVSFLENFGSEPQSTTSDIRLYLSCDRPTKAHVTYGTTGEAVDILVPTADSTIEVNIGDIFTPFVELQAADRGISRKTIQIVADDEITLYGVNIRFKSADAFLGLPDDVLTSRYIVLASPNGYDSQEGFDMPSEFAVIGTEDGTTVRIEPSALLNFYQRQEPFTIGLNRGEVFFAQAQTGVEQDVSGTEIRANKPVAVFAGTKRTAIPLTLGNFRDHLVEQMPPLEVWGNEAIATPFFPITPESKYPAVVRVLAAFDGTTWSIDGVAQGVLSKANPIERRISAPMHITASGPILVAHYEHSVGVDPGNPNSETPAGDPFMLLVPPPEQYDTAYSFQSIAHPEFYDTAHFVNVVIPTPATASLRIDGVPVLANWAPVPKPGYSFAQIRVSPGSHFIKADSAFGLDAYGYGSATSYGYIGGMLFRTLVHDFEPPELDLQRLCARTEGFVFDSHITDTGIDSLYATRDTVNVKMSIDSFVSGADTVHFSASLIDPFQDGVAAVKVIDKEGRSRSQSVSIPGFTLRTTGMVGPGPRQFDTAIAFNGAQIVRKIEIENYGRFPQELTGLTVLPSQPAGMTLELPANPIIQPGARDTVTVRFSGFLDTSFTVTLRIAGACNNRDVAILPITTAIDTIPPTIQRRLGLCNDELTLTLTDLPPFSAGIARVHWDTLQNATVSLAPGPESFPTSRVLATLHSIDFREDVIYQVTVTDQIGATISYRDTIGGFTVAVVDNLGDRLAMRLGRDWMSDTLVTSFSRCDSVTLSNYGSQPILIDHVKLGENRGFSIPPSQLPLSIAPGTTVRLGVCLVGTSTGDQVDTLTLVDACNHQEDVLLKVPVIGLTAIGGDRCNSALRIDTYGAAKRTFLTTPVPNPSTGSVATVDIGLPAGRSVSLEVLGANGEASLTILRGIDLAAGIHRITFDLSDLHSGTYFCRMSTAAGEVLVQKMIVSR